MRTDCTLEIFKPINNNNNNNNNNGEGAFRFYNLFTESKAILGLGGFNNVDQQKAPGKQTKSMSVLQLRDSF